MTLGRKTFTTDEIENARTAVAAQVAALRAHGSALDDPALVNGLLLGLDRRFVHRIRNVSGKDTNPDRIALDADAVERLAHAFLADLAVRFREVEPA